MTPEQLTIRQWGRSVGISRQAAHNAVKRCGIAVADGKVDAAAATALYRQGTRVRTNGPPRADDAPPPATAASSDETADYSASRARREQAEAAMAELRLGEQRGELIRVQAVQDALAQDFAITREGFMQLPPRLAAQLAAESDPAAVERMLSSEIHATLTRLAGAADAVGADRG